MIIRHNVALSCFKSYIVNGDEDFSNNHELIKVSPGIIIPLRRHWEQYKVINRRLGVAKRSHWVGGGGTLGTLSKIEAL